MSQEEVLILDEEIRDLWFGRGHSFNSKPALKKIWEDIKNDENVLMHAVKVNSDRKDFIAPNIVSLALLDYKNVDPIAYDVIVTSIYERCYYDKPSKKDNYIYAIIPEFLKEYELTYLVATLFNEELSLGEYRRNFLIKIGNLCLGSRDSTFAMDYERSRHFQGIFPIDIRYFILEHPAFKEMKDELIGTFYYNIDSYNTLLKDYETRVKLRSLKKLPF